MFNYVSVASPGLLYWPLFLASFGIGFANAQSPEAAAVASAPNSDSVELLVHLPLDGSLVNMGSLGGEADLVIFGDGAGPQFVAGKLGRAMYFDANGVLGLRVALSNDVLKNSTITAWVSAGTDLQAWGTIFSTGVYQRLYIQKLTSYAVPGGPLFHAEDRMTPGEWKLAYAIYNSDDLTVTVGMGSDRYVHNLKEEINFRGSGLFANPLQESTEEQRYVFVGSTDFRSRWPATKMTIDDVRLYRGTLSQDQINALAGVDPEAAPTESILSTSAVCTSHDECDSGFYCAWEQVCHPDSHAPMQDVRLPGDPVSFEMVPAAELASSPVPEVSGVGLADSGGSQPADATIGTPTPVGPPLFGGLSGNGGQFRTVMDLEDRFLRNIAWHTNEDGVLCGLHVDSTTNAADELPGTESISFTELCAAAVLSDETSFSALRAGDSAIAMLATCRIQEHSYRERLHELWLNRYPINANGTLDYTHRSTTELVLGFCYDPRPVSCPSQTAATGIAVHHIEEAYLGGGVYKQVTGVELICRDIALR